MNRNANETPTSFEWSGSARLVVSLLLLFHLTAVVTAPFAFACRANPAEPPSPAILPVVRVMQPYMDAAFLNHGYAFFAPNPPAASSLLRYRVERENGEPIEGVLPNIETHRPRLFYHRHFMLSEQLSARYVPPTPPPESDRAAYASWRRQRKPFRAAWRSFENHLLAKHDGVMVHMEFYDHRPPDVIEFLNDMPLNAPELYRPREGDPSQTTDEPEMSTP